MWWWLGWQRGYRQRPFGAAAEAGKVTVVYRRTRAEMPAHNRIRAALPKELT